MKRIISMLLVVLLVISMVPSFAVVETEAASTGLTLQQLREKFPHGKYWNHANNPGGSNSVNNQNGYTSTPCSKHGGLIGTSSQTCNGFQPGSSQLSWQCMGYAEKLGYDATGYNPRNNANGWQTYTSSSALNNLKPGDIVRYKTSSYYHSIYVIGVNGDTVTYTDCNSDGKCGIRWDKTISKSTLKSNFTHLRSAPSSATPGSQSCSCSTSHAGEYVCVTSGSSLNIRNGHGTNYTVIGSIPNGATVQISKATGTGNNDWGHVTYNGVTGYVSMQYLNRKGSGSNHADTPNIRWWLSDSEYGDSIDSADMKVGNRYYFCYRLYDSVTGKDWDEVQSDNYSVKLAIYNPDGSLNYEYTRSSDTGWISIFYTTPGTYTRKVVVSGDYVFEGSRTFDVAANPMKIHSSDSTVNLTLGSSSSKDIMVWTSGYHGTSTVLNYSCSNSNVSCSWGDWNDEDMVPLTITGNSTGSTTITLSVKDKATQTVLHSISVKVNITSTNYTVTYNANGGSGAPSNQTKQNGSDLTLSSTVPTRTGYNFMGWATSSSATSATYQPGGRYTNNSDVTLYAVWKQETISTFTKTSKTANISYAGKGVYFKFTPSATATYRFVGTDTVDNKITIYNASGTALVSNDDGASNRQFLVDYAMTAGTTYYIYVQYYSSSTTGSFTFDTVRHYNVSYNANGGTGAPSAQAKLHGTSLTLSSTQPTRNGYRFLGWATSSSATSASYSAGASFTSDADTTLYAVWKQNVTTYTITYNANGGTGAPSAQTKTHGTAITLSSTQPTRSGYTFLGWATSSSATSASYSAGASFTSDANTTLYAVWKQNVTTYTITYNANGGTGAPSAQTKTHGTAITLSSTQPTKTGFVFRGWATSSSATTATYSAGATFTADANTTLYAVWEMDVITYTVTYNANGGTGAPSAQTKIHDVALEISPTVPSRSNYTFMGWSTSATATTAEYNAGSSFRLNANTTLYAVWRANEKTLSSIQITSNPTKTSYVIGESLNTAGLKLKLTYSDGSTEIVTTGFTVSGFSSATAGTKTVTVSYGTKTATFTVTVTAPESEGSAPKVSVGRVNSAAGGTVTVDVMLENNPGIWGMALTVNFDPSKLTLVNVENGTIFSDNEWTEGVISGSSYILYFEESAFSDNTANGVIARLTFTVNENARQNDFYDISVDYRVGDVINISFEDIILEVESGGVVISSVLYGDANGDGVINVKDSLILKMYIAGGAADIDDQSADVYYDGVINSKDSLLLKKSLAGLGAVLGPQ